MKNNITCSEMDYLLYLTDDEMNSQELTFLSNHLRICPRCKKTHEEFLAARLVTVNFNGPIPACPDFTSSTEKRIITGQAIADVNPAKPINPIWQKTASIVRYASSIAAIFLLVLFVWEQTLSVKKISALENRIQSTIHSSDTGHTDRINLARNIFSSKEWTDFAVKLNINQSVTDRSDIFRIKNILEKRMRSKKTGELAFKASFRNSMTIKRNAITFNNLIK